jgi:hypothetical protein
MSTRPDTESNWAEPVNMGQAVNSSSFDGEASLSTDGLAMFFCSERPGGMGSSDLWLTTRPSQTAAWSPPVNLGPPVNTSGMEGVPSLCPDQKTLYFVSDRPGGIGGWDLWRVPIEPIVDFNGDGIVDFADLCRMADHWGEDDPSCDVGPMPWGDGIVDFRDLLVSTEYWLEEILDLRLLAHWKLDEGQGSVAADSAGGNDGTLHGDPAWQPTGGKIDGALQFDGVGDYVSTPSVLDPADGSFSVFARVKGGAAGQVIISQTDGTGTGATWLGAEQSQGELMTGLVPPRAGRFVTPPLVAEFIIADGQWYHIGFVWDGSLRHLYVDGTEVAKDAAALAPLVSSDGDLHIGAGKTPDAATFFSGLIDDVRIYNQALSAEQIEELAR